MNIFKKIIDAVKEARAPAPTAPRPPKLVVITPGTDERIELPALRLYTKPPTQSETMAEGRRIAWAYAKKRSGNLELSWKHAKLLLDRWEKEERAVEIQAQREAAARIRVQEFLERRRDDRAEFRAEDRE